MSLLPVLNFAIAVNNIQNLGGINNMPAKVVDAFDFQCSSKWNLFNLVLGIVYFLIVLISEYFKFICDIRKTEGITQKIDEFT